MSATGSEPTPTSTMRIFSNKSLAGPLLSFLLVLALMIGTSSIIFYVQSTLSEIEEALPIRLPCQSGCQSRNAISGCSSTKWAK
jgi:hypothetical protein